MKKIIAAAMMALAVCLVPLTANASAAHGKTTCSLQPVSPQNPTLEVVCTPVIAQQAVTQLAQDEYLQTGFAGPWSATVTQRGTTRIAIRVRGLQGNSWKATYSGDGVPFYFPQPEPPGGTNGGAQYASATGAAYIITQDGYVGAPPNPFVVTESGRGAVVTLTVYRAV